MLLYYRPIQHNLVSRFDDLTPQDQNHHLLYFKISCIFQWLEAQIFDCPNLLPEIIGARQIVWLTIEGWYKFQPATDHRDPIN